MAVRFVYIFSDNDQLTCGYCSDIEQTIKNNSRKTLAYLEEFNNKDEAFKRLDTLHAMTSSAKKVLIEKHHDRSEQLLNSL